MGLECLEETPEGKVTIVDQICQNKLNFIKLKKNRKLEFKRPKSLYKAKKLIRPKTH